MQVFKKLIRTVLALTIIFGIWVFDNNLKTAVPIFAFMEHQNFAQEIEDVSIAGGHNAYSTGKYFKYVFSGSKEYKNYRLGYHPDYDEYMYVDGYRFNITDINGMTADFGDGPIKVYVGNSPKIFLSVKADGSRKSRPWINADITVMLYDIYVYDSVTNKLLYINRNNYREAICTRCQYFVDYDKDLD